MIDNISDDLAMIISLNKNIRTHHHHGIIREII
jgi:hypothetical protein